jgi:hypothetical protein
MCSLDWAFVVIVIVILYLAFSSSGDKESFEEVHKEKVWPNFNPSVDMVEFRAEDPQEAKYTRHWDRDEWGLDSSEKYYNNLTYYNQGLSAYDPKGETIFDDPAGGPPLPGMSEVERLGHEVLGDQAASADPSQINLFRFRAENEGTMEDGVAGIDDE